MPRLLTWKAAGRGGAAGAARGPCAVSDLGFRAPRVHALPPLPRARALRLPLPLPPRRGLRPRPLLSPLPGFPPCSSVVSSARAAEHTTLP
eukprot:1357007-Rhodomonas_salina.4